MKCRKCGSRVGERDLFCPGCGMSVKASTGGVPPDAPGPGSGSGVTASADAGSDKVPPAGGSPERGESSPPVAPGREKTSGWAVASLILGIGSLSFLPVIGAVLAIVFGVLARRQVAGSPGECRGIGMASAGMTMGVIGLVIPLIAGGLLIGWGFVFWRSGSAARDNLIGTASSARVYYSRNGDKYDGMDAYALSEIEDSIEVRMAPGSEPEVVYIDVADGQSARLYCYSRGGHKYTGSARGEGWRYNFQVSGEQGVEGSPRD